MAETRTGIDIEAQEFAEEILSRPAYTPGRTDTGEFKRALEYILDLAEPKEAK